MKRFTPLIAAGVCAAGIVTTTSHAATIAYFKFDEGSGQDAASTGTMGVNPLKLGFSNSTGGDPAWVTGVEGSGLDFDPSGNNFVAYNPSQSDSAALTQDSSFTIELFFRPDNLPVGGNTSQTLISLYEEDGGLSTRNYELRLRTTTGTGNPTFLEGLYQNDNGLVGGVPFGSAALTAGETYYAALIYDASTDTLTTRLNNVTDVETGVVTTDGVFTDPAFVIGARTNGGTNYEQNFDGLIDEVRISNSVLIESELLINTIPEPGSMALLAAGTGLVFARRRG